MPLLRHRQMTLFGVSLEEAGNEFTGMAWWTPFVGMGITVLSDRGDGDC